MQIGVRASRIRWHPTRLIAAVIAVAVAVIWVAGVYHLSWLVVGGQSDSASVVLMGHAMAQGNVLLHGWTIEADPFWLTNDALTGLLGLVEGVCPAVLHQVPVAFDVALAGVAAWLARSDSGGLRPWVKPWVKPWVGAVLALAIVGLPSLSLAHLLLQDAGHVATVLCCLLAFAWLRSGRFTKAWLVGVVALTVAILADPLSLLVGVLPIAAAGGLWALCERRWPPLLAPVAGAALAVVLARLVRLAVEWLGGFHTSAAPSLVPPAQWLANLRGGFVLLWHLAGGGMPALSSAARVLVSAGTSLGAVLAAAGLAMGTGALVRDLVRGSRQPAGQAREWHLDHLLTVAVYVDVATFVALAQSPTAGDVGRYLLPGLVYGAVLAGRRLGWALGRLAVRPALALTAIVAVCSLAYLGDFAAGLRGRPAYDPPQQLAEWLSSQHLHHGWGGYWESSVVTVDSRQSAVVRPVYTLNGRLEPLLDNASTAWYNDPASRGRGFVAFNPGEYAPDDASVNVDAASAQATFGPASEIHQVGPYKVLVWDHHLVLPDSYSLAPTDKWPNVK